MDDNMDDIFYNVDDLLNFSDEELRDVFEGNNAGDMPIPLEVGSLFSVDCFYDNDWMKDFPGGELKQITTADFKHKMEKEQGPENTSENTTSSDLSSETDNRSCTGKRSILCSRMTIPGKPRSKRSRLPLSKWASKPISPIASSVSESSTPISSKAAAWSQSDYFASEQVECQSSLKSTTGKHGKKKEKKGIKKCTHCGVNKTPQWRCGPLGPKTLCNACGVRYKSGGLLPEYRPAASPTFSPDKHSNSSKVVLEMRRQKYLRGE
ncbi:hypothetical protein SUGI_1132600 [Cryptomeria japonica]|uniref:GATA transcription factor 9-like n=1 Tax=Cryptomeria japonica TaxID=3369 RepID=UPI0024146D76|nr:GATA transcription factor 9-like [Cryptomeria japonica]XP_057856696.2 GATA transcription factor 9-like [Cryptomeria japonica]GLJ53146.1 hypothetical protein SUGI_1132600 [Cryptomeria japonica]